MSDIISPIPELVAENALLDTPESSSGIPSESSLSSASGENEEAGFDRILAQFESSSSRRSVDESGQRSSQIQGTVVSITSDSVLIDIGYKTEGVLPLSEFSNSGETVSVGDILVVVSKGRNSDGYYDLSRRKVTQPKDISTLEAAFASGAAVSGIITSAVNGGFSVDIGVRAFLPGSRSGVRDAASLAKLIGQEIHCRIIKLEKEDEESVDVVVDRRAVLEEEEKALKDRRYAEMREGDIVNGTVRSLAAYGAFVNIGGTDSGGIDGLLHISDLAWHRVANPSDLLVPGQQVEVKILRIDPVTRKVGLGLKQLQPHPWDAVPGTYTVGERIRGTVTRLTNFGAFVELTPGVEGMIHVSDMSWARKVRKPEDMLKPGDSVEAVILSIDLPAQRIGLSLKQTLEDPWASLPGKFPVGSTITGPVSSLSKFGAFVLVSEGIEGMVHVSEILVDKRVERPQDVLRVGQVVQAKVLEIDSARRQLKLSMKQLVPTGLEEYIAEHKPGDNVTARILLIEGTNARVELGDGIYADCALSSSAVAEQPGPAAMLDLSAFTSQLNAKWKGGASAPKTSSVAPQPGQVRSFRIAAIDTERKQITVELAS